MLVFAFFHRRTQKESKTIMEIATSFTIEQYRISESSPPKKKKKKEVKPRNLDSWVYIYSERRKGATHQKRCKEMVKTKKEIWASNHYIIMT